MSDDVHRLNVALKAFGEECGLNDLGLDAEGRANIEVEGAPVAMWLAEEPVPHLMITVLIARLDPSDRDGPCILLRRNLAGWLTGAMTLGLDEDGAAIGYASLPAVAATARLLGDMVFALVTAAEDVREALARGEGGPPEDDRQPPAPRNAGLA